ncbi:MAG: divalent-cation tolerance protein CutA [Oligoflexia bacterium]|nr:divalent-cation tolerance protein CutA [Oligoflexia bacterium]
MVVFFSTFSSKKQAQCFAKNLISLRLAACVNVLPQIESHYFWKGKILKENEFLIIGKTTLTKFRQIKKKIQTLHSYQVPELICFEVTDAHPEYLHWVHSYL